MKLFVTSTALLDLEEIEDYIARDSPEAAARWVVRTMEEFTRLTKSPRLGEARDKIHPGMRRISHGSYVIYFQERADVLEIVRVLHGARDVRGLF